MLSLLLASSFLSFAHATNTTYPGFPTCEPYPLQTLYPYVAPPKNPGDFGPPFVGQGKASNGQPNPGGPFGDKRPRNLIMIIPDGFGPASETFARDFIQWKYPEDGWNRQLATDTIQIGSIRTRSSSSYVTDSAAAATAYACGIKTYNGALAVDENGNPCGTVLEAAKLAGYHTGLVVKSSVTSATPAAFVAHLYRRDDEDKIALQIAGEHPLGRVVDVFLGGGIGHFQPKEADGSLRGDNINATERAVSNGYNIFTDRAAFDALQGGNATTAAQPYLGMFAQDRLDYAVDRDDKVQPTLAEMTMTAIRSLERMSEGKEKGFFIMIEASLIDDSAHGLDLIAHLHEVLEYNEVVGHVKEYVDAHQDDTTFIGMADHECGGLTLGGITPGDEDQWTPGTLAAGTRSSEALIREWIAYDGPDVEGKLRDLYAQYGITNPNATEIALEMEWRARGDDDAQINMVFLFGRALSRRAMVKWGTDGHSAVDVNLIGTGLNAERMMGNHDNTEIANFVSSQLGLDLPNVAQRLNDPANDAWLVNVVGRDMVEHGQLTRPSS